LHEYYIMTIITHACTPVYGHTIRHLVMMKFQKKWLRCTPCHMNCGC